MLINATFEVHIYYNKCLGGRGVALCCGLGWGGGVALCCG